jgi:hypothetical protein
MGWSPTRDEGFAHSLFIVYFISSIRKIARRVEFPKSNSRVVGKPDKSVPVPTWTVTAFIRSLSPSASWERASRVRQCVAGFFVAASSLKLLSSKTVARFGSSAPLISSSQFESTFFALMSDS